jgi:hypothetical protein
MLVQKVNASKKPEAFLFSLKFREHLLSIEALAKPRRLMPAGMAIATFMGQPDPWVSRIATQRYNFATLKLPAGHKRAAAVRIKVREDL